MIITTISVGAKVVAVFATILTILGGIAVWATWPEEK